MNFYPLRPTIKSAQIAKDLTVASLYLSSKENAFFRLALNNYKPMHVRNIFANKIFIFLSLDYLPVFDKNMGITSLFEILLLPRS
jgi:hypothetical protein